MGLCKLCNEREANKKNTHYLTDGIIRSCLNIDGSNVREKGLYFDMSTSNPFIKFNFQRLDEVTLQNTLGREPTDEELENARSIPFSVDFIFCSQCENLFSEIETKFLSEILPKLRDNDLTGLNLLSIGERKICRDFFYIQIYRSAECEDILNFSPEFVEKLRNIILNKVEDLSIPVSITYLQTLGGQKHYTENFVGFTSDQNPFIIMMNDLVIQVYEREENIKYLEFHGLNDEATYRNFININEDNFIIKILSNEQRKTFLNELMKNEKVKSSIEYFKKTFDLIWLKLFNTYPPASYKYQYLQAITGENNDRLLKYTEEQVISFTAQYIMNLIYGRSR